MRVQRFGEHRAMPWANCLGTSYEVASDRNVDGVWTWRVAVAPVIKDGPFSSLPGVDRKLVIVEGNGMVLDVDGKSEKCLPGQVVQFSGDSTTFAQLIAGPIVDLGLMTVMGSATGLMSVATEAGELPGSRVIVALSEKVEIEIEGSSHLLDRLDAVIQEDEKGACLISGVVACLVVS